MPFPAMQMLQAAVSGPANWYDAWSAAYTRAAAGSGQAHVVCFGDSLSQGFYADAPYYVNGFAGWLGTELATRTGQTAGTGIIPAYEEFTITDARTSSAGTWTASTSGFFADGKVANASGDTYTLGPITCTGFRIWYAVGAGGAWTATVDGGAANNYTCAGTASVQIAALDFASGSHTLVIAGSGDLHLLAVEAVNNTTQGVKVSRLAKGSQECSTFVADASATSSRQCYLLTDPDLAIIEFGLNEALLGTTTATFKTHLTTLATDMINLGASVLIVAAPPPNTATIAEATWTTFRVAMEEVATALSCGFLDMVDYWPSYAANSAFYYYDNVHPNQAGHIDMARAIITAAVEPVDPSAATITPTDISNLGGWWDASDAASFTYHSGGLVSQWNDRSGNSNHFTQPTSGNAPDRKSTVNGQYAVLFDGVDNWLGAGDVLDLGTSSLSVFMVVRRNAVGANHSLIGKYKITPSDGAWFTHFINTNKMSTVFDPGTVATADSGVTTSVDSRIFGFIIDRATGDITNRIDRATNGTTTFTPDSGSSRNTTHGLYMGALRNAADSGFQAAYWLSAHVCEVLVYTKALDSTERAQVEAYLQHKWLVYT